MPKRQSPPSAHDVARIAGVSQAAVSRAFTPGASISDATRAKVLRAAEKLGYRPNLIARSLITGESGIVGIVSGNRRSPFFMSAFDMLLAYLSKLGKHCLVFNTEFDAKADAQVEQLLKFRVDALVLMAATLSDELVEHCRADDTPVIFFGRKHRVGPGHLSMVGDNRKGGREIAEHLLLQGYTRVAYMAGRPDSPTSREREAGFTAHLQSKGCTPLAREVGNFTRESAIEAARRLLARKPRLDAIFCANDIMALATIEIARYEFGLEIGRELGIAGFDDIEQASWPSFDLTTYSLPLGTMIEEIGRLLVAPKGERHEGHKVIRGVLKPRGSTTRKRS